MYGKRMHATRLITATLFAATVCGASLRPGPDPAKEGEAVCA